MLFIAIYSATDGACLYVGQSKHIEARFRQHVTKLKNRRTGALPRFVEWYHAHGAQESLLHLVILEKCADDDLVKNELEAFWFDELRPRFYGKAPSLSETWTHSGATRAKIAESARMNLGNPTGSSKRVSLPCLSCGVFTLSKKQICRSCHKAQQDTDFDLQWFDKIRVLYCEEGLSTRAIGRELSVPHGSVNASLKRHGIAVTPRSFNGLSHQGETLARVKAPLIARAAKQKANRVVKACERDGCSVIRDYKPSDVKRYCSRACYILAQKGTSSPKKGKRYTNK